MTNPVKNVRSPKINRTWLDEENEGGRVYSVERCDVRG
jgi:hypothetical protein